MKLTPIRKERTIKIGLTRISVKLASLNSGGIFQSQFLVDTGVIDSIAPASELRKIGINPIGKKAYELASGSIVEYEFGLAQIEFMNETTAGELSSDLTMSNQFWA